MNELNFIQPKKTVGKLISVDVLNKIRAEIIENAKRTMNDTRAEGLYMALNIVDKYKAESEVEE